MATDDSTKRTPFQMMDALEELQFKLKSITTLYSVVAGLECKEEKEDVDALMGRLLHECYDEAAVLSSEITDHFRKTGQIVTPPEVLAQLETLQ